MQLENENHQFIAKTQQIQTTRKTDHIHKNNRFYKILITMKQEISGDCHEKDRDSDSEERGGTRVRGSFRWREGRRASCGDMNAELLAETAVTREGAREVEVAGAVESDFGWRGVEGFNYVGDVASLVVFLRQGDNVVNSCWEVED